MTNEKTLQEAQNNVHIEGIVKEVRIEEGKLPAPDNRELIKAEVDIEVNENSVHTVHMFSFKLKKGTTNINNIYKGIQTIGEEYAAGDKVRVNQGSIKLNEYIGQDDKLRSYPQINSNFVNRVKDTDAFEPSAKFTLDMMVANVKEETNKDGEETGRAIIKGYVPLYGGVVIPFEVVVEDSHAVNYVTSTYEKGSTVTIHGDIVNQTVITKREVEVGFGAPQEKIDRSTIREYLVKGGTAPLDEDDKNAFDLSLIKKALTDREVYIQGMKDKKAAKEQRGNSGNNAPNFGTQDPFGGKSKSAKDIKDPFADDSKPIDISDDDLPF
jgi:hypothetical protein